MASVCPKGGALDVREIKELIKGCYLEVRLQALLSDPELSGERKAAEMLGMIIRSVSPKISLMRFCDYVGGCKDAMSGDSGESKTRPGSKEWRGCYKRSYIQRHQKNEKLYLSKKKEKLKHRY